MFVLPLLCVDFLVFPLDLFSSRFFVCLFVFFFQLFFFSPANTHAKLLFNFFAWRLAFFIFIFIFSLLLLLLFSIFFFLLLAHRILDTKKPPTSSIDRGGNESTPEKINIFFNLFDICLTLVFVVVLSSHDYLFVFSTMATITITRSSFFRFSWTS